MTFYILISNLDASLLNYKYNAFITITIDFGESKFCIYG